ncbi:DUF3667 domain-containing protein [Mucilaginibacter sp. HMF5004]|uniref:DUF3667 domain-containing protein n=1 Tax=Mucilaginibacter rivuli TaxID=2857527 RepID=UPI001C5E1106|nr:DUF3667 domain-containing protein [Mucilaginibacter rivuli]MBW4888676.1 DUF3667 domain-containing protein [Mucilaginibacter rivuli]
MNCKSCGNTHQENFCPNCGEKKFHPGQLSLKHFVEETFEGFIHFDSKFFYTLKTLITKPGQLSLDYAEGRRIRSMRPVQFFLIINLLFFFLIMGHNLYSLSLDNYISYRPFTNYNTRQIIKEKLAESKTTTNEYKHLFNEKITTESKEFIFLFIPFYGFIFYLLFFWKQKYFTTHLSFAAHFISFVLLWNLVSFWLITVPFYLITKVSYSEDFDSLVSLLTAIIIATYVAIAIRRFYKPHTFVAVLVALGIGATYFSFIQYYRMALFFKIVYWS